MVCREKNHGRRRALRVAAGLVLCLSALLIYLPGFKVPFIYDDRLSIVENDYIHIADLRPGTLKRAAFQDFLHNRPLTNLSFALNYYFNGLNPLGYHAVNFILLVLTALGIWLWLEKLLASARSGAWRTGLAAWLSALVWVAHPVNVQAVTYISQRHTSCAGAFAIWSMYFYHLGMERKKGGRRLFVLAGLFCLFGLLCKETVFILPAILFGYKLYFFDEFRPGRLKRNWIWIAGLAVFYGLLAAVALRPSMIALMQHEFHNYQFTATQRLLSEPRILLWYLAIVIFPAPQLLTVEHDFAISTSWFHPSATWISFVILMALSLAAVFEARRRKFFSWAVAWYLGQLLVELMPVPIDLAFDHRLYLASLSIIVPAVSWPVLRLKKPGIAIGWVVVTALFFAGFSRDRNLVWGSAESLWKDAVIKAPASYRSWYNYCTALGESGNCRSAILACQKAIAFIPAYYRPHHNLGTCYFRTGQFELAEKELLKSTELCMGECMSPYMNLALFYGSQKEYDRATRWYLAAIGAEPRNAKAHYFLAANYRLLKREKESLEQLRKALNLDPELISARTELANALVAGGECGEALKLVRAAPAQDPAFAEIVRSCQKR